MFPVAPVLAHVPRFGAAGWVVVLVMVGYLALVAPLTGRRAYRRLRASRDHDPGALLRFYRRNALRKWLWVPPALLVLAVVPGLLPVHLGLAWPAGPYAAQGWVLFWYGTVLLGLSGYAWRRRARRGRSVPGQRLFRALLPGTAAERQWAVVVAVTAGVCEELLFRGLLMAAALSLGWPATVAVLATSALFGVVHLYQGWFGIVGTGVLGLLFAGLYLGTGSLLFPVVLHTLIDVRGLLLVPPAAPVPTDR